MQHLVMSPCVPRITEESEHNGLTRCESGSNDSLQVRAR
jgi:hypothetical protein